MPRRLQRKVSRTYRIDGDIDAWILKNSKTTSAAQFVNETLRDVMDSSTTEMRDILRKLSKQLNRPA